MLLAISTGYGLLLQCLIAARGIAEFVGVEGQPSDEGPLLKCVWRPN